MGFTRLALPLSLLAVLGLAPAPLAAHRAEGQAPQAGPKNPPPTQGRQQPAGQAPAAPAAGDDQSQATFKAGINFVRVDVIVTDRSGNPIHDLKPEDFEITEQGKTQKIETFKLADAEKAFTAMMESKVRFRAVLVP